GESLMDGAAGTHGITAGPDCVARLARDGDVFCLEGEGREIEEYRFALKKDIRGGIGWYMTAKGEDARYTAERDDIFRLLKEDGQSRGMSPKQIQTALGKNGSAIRRLLRKMLAAGQVYQNADRNYVAI